MDTRLTVVMTPGLAASLGDLELLDRMRRIAAAERTLSVYALSHLAEIQRRSLYAKNGFPSMFAYCVGELRYSEATAYRRLQSADAARKFPEILALLKDGALTVCALSAIAKHLTPENSARLLEQASGKSARDVMRLAATLAPLPDTKDSIRSAPARKVEPVEARIPSSAMAADPEVAPEPRPPAVTPPPLRPDVTIPRGPERVHFGFTGSEELSRVIDRLRELLWHKYPDGRLEDVLLEAGNAYLERNDPLRARTPKQRPPRKANRRTSARWVRSTVYRRDGGRCTFVSASGRRCEARRGLEYDHVKPWSRGGPSDDPRNIRLLCRAHNQLAAREAGLL